MAFANNLNGQPFVTEKDIFRQLASNYTKDNLTS